MKEVSSQNPSPPDAVPARWWADEMLGRLARYLRMVGLDTAYVPGLSDDEVTLRARSEGRTLITRDRALALHTNGAILLAQTSIEGQWRELRARFPTLPTEPRFDRCTICNALLRELPSGSLAGASNIPRDIQHGGRAVYQCTECGHPYWQGSHVESLRRRLAGWSGGGSP
jgi:uncharacterized protein with PIN domain